MRSSAWFALAAALAPGMLGAWAAVAVAGHTQESCANEPDAEQHSAMLQQDRALERLRPSSARAEACPDFPTASGCYIFMPSGCPKASWGGADNTWWKDRAATYDGCAQRAKTNADGFDAWCGTTDAIFYFVPLTGDTHEYDTHEYDGRVWCASPAVAAQTPAPTPVPPPPCTTPCGNGCLEMVESAECPDQAHGLPNCDKAAVGEFCEGDGECGTSNRRNNCHIFDVYRIG